MCGIVGYVGPRDATTIIYDGLKRLEYRGYDSAGLAVIGNGSLQIRRAWKQACKIDSDYQNCLSAKKLTYAEALAQLYPIEWDGQKKLAVRNPTLNIALVGHPYCLYDNYINHDLIAQLRQLGVCVHTSEMVSLEEAQTGIDLTTGQTRWFYENWMSGAAGSYLMDPKIDGVISVMAFTCGPDSVMVDTISRRAHALKRPFMNLVLDEHGSSAGMITRLEAFVDMLNRQRAAQAAAGEIVMPTDLLIGLVADGRRSQTPAVTALTQRELELLQLLAVGQTSETIAQQLSISQFTVRTHIRNMLSKLGVHSRLEAVAMALRQGLIRPPE